MAACQLSNTQRFFSSHRGSFVLFTTGFFDDLRFPMLFLLYAVESVKREDRVARLSHLPILNLAPYPAFAPRGMTESESIPVKHARCRPPPPTHSLPLSSSVPSFPFHI